MRSYFFTILTSLCIATIPIKMEAATVRAIILLEDNSQLLNASARKKVSGIFTKKIKLPGNEDLLESLLTPVLQSPLDSRTLDYIEDQIFAYYRELGMSNIKVTIADSAPKDGVVQIIIECLEEKVQNPIRAIVIGADSSDLMYGANFSEIKGIQIQNDLENKERLTNLLTPILEQEFSEQAIAEIQAILIQQYPDIAISIPVQTKETGIVQIIAKTPPKEPEIPIVKAIVLLPSEDELLPQEKLRNIEGVCVNLPCEETLNALLEKNIGLQFNNQTLQSIQNTLLDHYGNEDGSTVELIIPAQQAETQVLQIVVKYSPPAFTPVEEPAIEVVAVEEPVCEEPKQIIESPEVKKPKIKGIVLLSGNDDLLDENTLKGIEGILVSGFKVPGNECELERTLGSILEEPFNENTLNLIQDQIYEFYRASDRPFVIIDVPEQTEETGVAQIIVQESTLGKISVVGNKWTPNKRYENYFRMKPGDPISQKRLNRDVDFMNRNPYRFVNVIYSPGEKEYTTDLTLEVSDRKPYFFYAGLDNTGVPTTGRARVFAGFSWDQMFGLDQLFFYQYSTNYSQQRYHSNSFQYMVMLPWESILNLYGGFSIMHADLNPAPMHNKGTNIQASIRYVVPFAPKAHFSQEIIAGFDIKNTNNTIEFTDTDPIIGHDINMTQWLLSYKCKYEWKKIEVEGGLEGIFSPLEWLPNQTNADFATLRPNATNTWFYAAGYCNIRRALPHAFSTVIRMNGQYSPSTLIPAEQIGLGGHASVRGYDERQYNGDSGFILNWEVHSPHFSLFRAKKRSLANNAYFLAFFDGGCAFDNSSVPKEKNANFLAGIGAGFRYSLGTYLNARCDYGFKLHHQLGFTGGELGHIHFSVSGSY